MSEQGTNGHNAWPTDYVTDEELQTLEYVLEYGGEGGSSALMRTHLRGRPRYWQLTRESLYDDDTGDIYETGRSDLHFLAHSAPDALTSAHHPWWKLVGLNVAPDLLPHVEAALKAHQRSLDGWLHPDLGQDPEVFTCSFMWEKCDVPRRPVDAYWLTARPQVMRRLLGGLSRAQIEGLRSLPGTPVGVLVDRRGRVLLTEQPFYPVANMWNGYSPFQAVRQFTLHALVDLWHIAPTVKPVDGDA